MSFNIAGVLLQFGRCFERETGQTLAEYSLILAFIAAACIIAVTALGLAIAGQLDAVTAVLP